MANEKQVIDANALTKALENTHIRFPFDKGKMLKLIEDAPTVDAVDVVRCKDCKYYEHPEYYGGGTKDVCRTFKRQTREDDFCSYGKRREPL